MNKVVSDIRRFLFTCSGEDNYILKRCNNSMQLRFALIGFLVMVIFLGCLLSAGFFFYSLFQHSLYLSISIGVFWGIMVVNIYLLLLHTISPAIIPLSVKRKRAAAKESDVSENKSQFLTVSMFLRIGFMMLLAIIIAQPLNVHVLGNTVATNIEKFKIVERVKLYIANNVHLIEEGQHSHKDFNNKVKYLTTIDSTAVTASHLSLITTKIKRDSLFIVVVKLKLEQLKKIEDCPQVTAIQKSKKESIIQSLDNLLNFELATDESYIDSLNAVSFSGKIKNEWVTFKKEQLQVTQEKINNYNTFNNLLNHSNFYVKTIQLLLAENPLSWLITILVCLIFLLPIYFKYKVRDLSARLFSEKDYEKEIKQLRAELIHTTDFNWLEKKVKTTNIHNIRTSDYYFQRMLIEHKIVLEEYDNTKKLFSEILTKNIKKYNEKAKKRLLPLLDKIEQINPKRYHEYYNQIIEEFKDEVIIKYEYWLDMPFRTKKVDTVAISNTEVGLLVFVYK